MEPLLLDGLKTSKIINKSLIHRARKLQSQFNFKPVLATIIVGNDHSSQVYVRMKANACIRAEILSEKIIMNECTSTEEIVSKINELNNNPEITGILLQHPVPEHIDEQKCFNAISIKKDVDGVNNLSFARTSMGLKSFKCATPYGIIKLLRHYRIPISGKNVVIMGRSPILGKPLSMLMLNENATVTVCHSKTENIEQHTRNADILCVGIGKAKYVNSSWIKKGAIVVDAGYNPGNIGDTDIEELKNKTAAYTPVPGGVGPMTIISLIEQTIEAAEIYCERYRVDRQSSN